MNAKNLECSTNANAFLGKSYQLLWATLLITSLTFAGCVEKKEPKILVKAARTVDQNTKIQVALLLDTSGSMSGLIDQAKSRLWNIVNTLTTLKYEGKTPDIEIALYEYGNSGLSESSNYIREIAALTTDLDLISEKLFSLTTNGGEEYCGAVIEDAVSKLDWSGERVSMKLVYIAGNEPFNQGPVNYKEAISGALKNDIFVNTIFCGDSMEGIRTFWKDGADYGKGKYFNIDSNATIRYIQTPYDDKISACNVKINETYIGYGSQGIEKKRNQIVQDQNAESVSKANYAERSVSKSKTVYKNESWDLVDKVKEDKNAVSKIKNEDLPKELQNKSKEEIEVIVANKAKERTMIQKEISELAKKRQEYIDAEAKKSKTQDDLGNAISTSIVTFAQTKGYKVEQ